MHVYKMKISLCLGIFLCLSICFNSFALGKVCQTLDVSEPGGSWTHEGDYTSTSKTCNGQPTWSRYHSGTEKSFYIYRFQGSSSLMWVLGTTSCGTQGIARHVTNSSDPVGTWEAISPSGNWDQGYTLTVTCTSYDAGTGGGSDGSSEDDECDKIALNFPGNYEHEGEYSAIVTCSCCGGRSAYYSPETSYYIYYDDRFSTWYIAGSLCSTHAISSWGHSGTSPVGSWPDGETIECAGISPGEIAGIVIGVFIGVVMIVIAIFCCVALCGKKHNSGRQILVRPARHHPQVVPVISTHINGPVVIAHAPPPYSAFDIAQRAPPGYVEHAHGPSLARAGRSQRIGIAESGPFGPAPPQPDYPPLPTSPPPAYSETPL